MIKYSKAVVNNKCEITFDFTPQDIKYSRSNYTATHKGGGTTARQGIWEGIECIQAQIKIGSEAWKTYTLPANKKVVVTVASNNVAVQACGKYRLKTMGYYFKDTTGTYPFFWFGNISGVASKYQKGYFTDSASNKPDSNFYTINAMVPADWTYIKAEWSDWAYKHAQANTKTEWKIDKGRYAQRNGNTLTASYSNGWISDSGYKQIYRKSSLFWFEKTYYSDTVTTSGIAVNPGAPTINVIAAKGDTGDVQFFYNSNNSGDGVITVEAKCSDKIVTLMDYNNSPTFGEQWRKTLSPDFNSIFGESYRANDVYYRAKAKNIHNYESNWTAWTGVHRYNGRPTVPKNPKATGKNGLMYDRVILSWNASSDPDGDSLYYQLYITATDRNGNIVKNGFIHERLFDTSYEYDISAFPDGTNFVFKVKASDSRITSDWSTNVYFDKGSKPTSTIALIAPIKSDTTIYSIRPRFGFEGYESGCTAYVIFNSQEYNSLNNPEMFDCRNNKFIFKPNWDITDGAITIKAYIKNSYGESNHTQIYKFTKKTAVKKFIKGDVIYAKDIEAIKNIIDDMFVAYSNGNQAKPEIVIGTDTIILAKAYNDMLNVIKTINNYINNIIPNGKFTLDINNNGVNVRELIMDNNWIELISNITSI